MAEGEIVLYQTADGSAQLQLTEMGGSVWMSQAEIADLYQISPQAVTQHIRSIYAEGELTEQATCKQDLQVRSEGERWVSRTRQPNMNLQSWKGDRVRKADVVKAEAHASYVTFDQRRKQGEALAADAADMEDLKAIEGIAKAVKRGAGQ